MKVNFNRHFKKYDGSEAPEIMRDIMAQALFNMGAGRNVESSIKFKAYMLSQKIMNATAEVEITTEEATIIKETASAILTAGGYGQIYELIENR